MTTTPSGSTSSPGDIHTELHGEQHGNVLSALGGRIVSGELAAGQVLTLEDICHEYGVSRSVAREAMRVLESMSLAASRRRVGITILPRASVERL